MFSFQVMFKYYIMESFILEQIIQSMSSFRYNMMKRTMSSIIDTTNTKSSEIPHDSNYCEHKFSPNFFFFQICTFNNLLYVFLWLYIVSLQYLIYKFDYYIVADWIFNSGFYSYEHYVTYICKFPKNNRAQILLFIVNYKGFGG